MVDYGGSKITANFISVAGSAISDAVIIIFLIGRFHFWADFGAYVLKFYGCLMTLIICVGDTLARKTDWPNAFSQ